ncbi:hypothetical protein [Streptomyces sp. NBC_01717]|uniref:hypothetical protein n=1 Tax=Streptomyces sp. NBC_01717 TaxID=2975918 RepID=UPI003FCD66FD
MAQLGTYPALGLVRQWLKAGVVERGRVTATEEGTPQGGVISPVLLNVALHGMEAAAGVRCDTGGIVTGHHSARGGQGFLPVLGTPQAGVGRVDRDDRKTLFSGHRDQPGLELPGRHAGDELPEPLAAPVLLAGLLRREVEVFDTDRADTGTRGPVDQAGQRVADLRVTVTGRTGQVVAEAVRPADRVPDIRRLAAACQRPLIMRGLRDRTRDPRRRQCRQLPLTHRPTCPHRARDRPHTGP